MKKCTKCGIQKDLTCYGKNRKYLRSDCKDCVAIREKKWYYENGGKEKIAASNKKYYENRLNNPNEMLFQRARDRAKEKNIPFDITAEDIIIPETCPVLGIQLQIGEKVACNNSPSLDRIKPELGYVKGNIQVLSHRANTLKSNATIEELEKVLEHLKKIV
jgi:hypothetical protein